MYVESVWGDLGTEWKHNFDFICSRKFTKEKTG